MVVVERDDAGGAGVVDAGGTRLSVTELTNQAVHKRHSHQGWAKPYTGGGGLSGTQRRQSQRSYFVKGDTLQIHKYKQTGRETDIQIYIQTDKQTDQTDRQPNIHTYNQTNKQPNSKPA